MKQFLILFFIISNVFSQTLSNKATFFLSDSTRLDYLDEFDNFYIKKIIKDLRHELNKERKRDFEKPFRLVFHPEERTSRFTGKFKFFDNNVGRQLFQKELKYLKMLSAAQGNTFSKEGERAIAAKHGGLAETKTQKIPAWTERLNKKILPTDWAIWANLNTDYYPSWEDLKSHFGGIEEMIAAGITGKKDVMEFGVLIEIDSLEFTSKSQWKSNITFTIKNEIAREFYNVKFFNQKSDLGFKTFPIGGKYNYLKKRKHQSVNILSQLENPDYNSFLRLKHQKVNVNKSNLIIDNDVYNVNMLISLDKIKNRIFSFADNDSTPSNSRKVFFTFSNKPDIPIVFGFESFFNSFEEFGNGIFENFNDWEDDFVIAFQNLINSLDSKIDDEIFIDLLIKEFDLTRKLLFIESGCFFLPYDKYYNTVDKYYDKLEYQILKLEFQEILNEFGLKKIIDTYEFYEPYADIIGQMVNRDLFGRWILLYYFSNGKMLDPIGQASVQNIFINMNPSRMLNLDEKADWIYTFHDNLRKNKNFVDEKNWNFSSVNLEHSIKDIKKKIKNLKKHIKKEKKKSK